MDVYLSREHPRWNPRTEADLQAALDDGLFDESHRLEAKERVEPGKSANRELARDLASFAIDSGTVIIGIREDRANGTFHLAPQPLDGLAERIEAVAYTIPDPPLGVVIDTVRATSADGLGYLIVHVPPSSTAPHMVDGRYLARGEKQKRYLDDAEVARLHALRRRVDADVDQLLQREIDRDPASDCAPRRAHLFLVAQPTAARPDMLLPVLDGNGWQQQVLDLITAARQEPLPQIGGFSPGLQELQSVTRRAAGAAAHACGITTDRSLNPEAREPEQYSLDVEFRYDGGIRIFMGRLSDNLQRHAQDAVQMAVFESAAVLFVRHLIQLAALVAERTGYMGSWGLGFAATGLRGTPSYTVVKDWLRASNGYTYDTDEERQVYVATYPELTRRRGAIADRLTGHLLRAYGLRDRYLDVLTDEELAPVGD